MERLIFGRGIDEIVGTDLSGVDSLGEVVAEESKSGNHWTISWNDETVRHRTTVITSRGEGYSARKPDPDLVKNLVPYLEERGFLLIVKESRDRKEFPLLFGHIYVRLGRITGTLYRPKVALDDE